MIANHVDRIKFRSPWVDSIPSGWDQVKLGHISKIYSGGTPDKKVEEYWSNGTVPWLNSGTVNQGLITEVSEFISEQAMANSSARWVPAGALVMALAGQGKTKGMVAQLGIDATCNQSMAAIVLDDDHPRYIMYWLSSNYRNIRGIASDDTRDGLNLTNLKSIPCPRPPYHEQIAIAAYLDAETKRIDGLIEEKKKLKGLLGEAVAGAIERATIPPPGSKRQPLKRFVLQISTGPFGSALHSSEYVSDGVAVINPTHIVDGKVIPDIDVTVTHDKAQRLSAYRLEPNDIVVGRRGEMGRCGVVPQGVVDWLCGTGSLMIKPNVELSIPDYLQMAISSKASRDWLSLESVGSTMENLNSEILGRLPCYVPSVDEQLARLTTAKREIEDLNRLQTHVDSEIKLLTEMRSATITDAVLGRIDVRKHQTH